MRALRVVICAMRGSHDWALIVTDPYVVICVLSYVLLAIPTLMLLMLTLIVLATCYLDRAYHA